MPDQKTMSMWYAMKAIAKKKGNREQYKFWDKKIKAYERKEGGNMGRKKKY